jgi:alkylation response protein AidB-like acyl-CoA dehydrogenase
VVGPLPSSAEEWRVHARQFASTHLAPIAREVDRNDRLPPAVIDELRRGRFFGVGIPPSVGGAGGDARAVVAVLEELAAQNAGVAVMVAVHLSVAAAPILEWGTDAQREKFGRPLAEGRLLGAFALTEPSAGSDAARLECRYRRDGNDYILRGAKMFITNGGLADLVVLFATRDPSAGHRGITGFLVSKGDPGVAVAQHLNKLGLRGSETTELVLDDLRLDEGRRLGAEGEGFRIAMSALVGGRLGIAACALGVARAAFEEMRTNARSAPEDWKGAQVARSFTDLNAAAALVGAGAERRDSGRPFEEAASCAKLFASKVAVEIASHGIDVAGRTASLAGSRAERLMRDARVFPIVEGTTEIQELILGRRLVGGPASAEPG